MKTYTVIGGAGTEIYVDEIGNPCGQPILFIHGLSQSRLSWLKQMNSDLARTFRLVAMDLRGHGFSQKPKSGYKEAKNWADDIQAVICTLNLYKPVLVAWSYGGLIVCDYIRSYGEKYISGINFVSAVTTFGTEEAERLLGSEIKALFPGLVSNNTEKSSETLQKFVPLVYRQPLILDYYFILGFVTVVPPYVRKEMLSRSVSNDDILSGIRKPVLITQGTLDRIVLASAAMYIADRIPHAEISFYENAGHSPFWENSARFNYELGYFIT